MINYSEERTAHIESILSKELEKFREAIKTAADDALSNVYCDVLPHIETDTDANMSNRVSQSLMNILEGKFEDISTDTLKPYIKVADGYGFHSYIHLSQYNQICKNIYEMCKEDLENNVIENLKQEVKYLKEQLNLRY